MEMPEVTKCFETFPPKHATYMISVFGLGSGGFGLAGIILYGLIEKSIMYYLYGDAAAKMDVSLKKVVLLSIGLTSLLLLIANVLLFLGATVNSGGALEAGVWIILIMCMILIFESIGLPLACFFDEKSCVIKKLPTSVMVICGLMTTVFLELWLYFMVVAYNYLGQL